MIAHRFLNYLLDPKVAYENFVGYVGYQPPLTAIDAERAVRQRASSPSSSNGGGHARGLRERQRVPGADRRRAAAVGPAWATFRNG